VATTRRASGVGWARSGGGPCGRAGGRFVHLALLTATGLCVPALRRRN
jgi:hypothetical protein